MGHSAEDVKKVKECADEHNIKAGDMEKFFDDKSASKDLKCFMKCVLEQFDVLQEDGSFELTHIKESSHEADLLPYAEECVKAAKKNDDLCEMAYEHNLCMNEKAPEDKLKKTVMEFMDKV